MNRRKAKKILGRLPYTVELYWHMVQRHQTWQAHFRLDILDQYLVDAVKQAQAFREKADTGKKIYIFASLHYWIEKCALLGLALAGKRNQVTFSFLPYANWDKPIEQFDLRRQNAYAKQILNHASSLINVKSLLDIQPLSSKLPEELERAVEEVSVFDCQYTLQREEIAKTETLYKLRYERNREAALKARAWLIAHKPDLVILPNGTIQEMGVVYWVAKHLGISTVTFEFGDQRERIWIAQNAQIMLQDTDDLWNKRGNQPLDESQLANLSELYEAREAAQTWMNFSRKWQEVPSEGGQIIRQKLQLDGRPVVLLATNVLGDSLTLGRQVFTKTMTEWVQKTIQFFTQQESCQLLIRIHPGELLINGASLVTVVESLLDEDADHIHIIRPDEQINTYDLLDITDLGLVYSTTVGLEMAMRGIPVIVAGNTHYRNRGFTHDPESWEEYFSLLDTLLQNLECSRLTSEQVALSRRYAWLFFFKFPKPYPWHLIDFKEDYQQRPMDYVLGEIGDKKYGETFDFLSGKPISW